MFGVQINRSFRLNARTHIVHSGTFQSQMLLWLSDCNQDVADGQAVAKCTNFVYGWLADNIAAIIYNNVSTIIYIN